MEWTATKRYRFPDQAAYEALAVEYGAVDVIGAIDGEGWHVNARWLDQEPDWAEFEVFPEHPQRDFA